MRNKEQTGRTEKTNRQRAAGIGIIIGILTGCVLLAYAATTLFGSKSAAINNTKGQHFAMDLTDVQSGIEVVPEAEQTLSPVVANKSKTEKIYAFLSFEFDPSIYKIEKVEGWELFMKSDDQVVYSYSSNNQMNEVGIKQTAAFSGTLKTIADGEIFHLLTDSDLVVDVTGYAISTNLCQSDDSTTVWQAYQNAVLDGNN